MPPSDATCGIRAIESRWQQIGMAMPPALAGAVARSIVAYFEALARDRGVA